MAKRMARDGAPLLVADVLAVAGNRLPIWVLATLGSFEDAGVYALAFAFVTVVGIAQRIQGGTLSPFVASAYHAGDRKALEKRVRITAAATSSITIAGSIALLFLGAILVPRVFGSDFEDTVAVAAILLLGTAAAVLAGPCALVLNVSGNERWTALASLIPVGIAAVVIFPASLLGGSIGAAAAMTGTSLVRTALHFFYAKRRTGVVTAADFPGLYRTLSRNRG
jgi:O-antigen/teichoic acid export membrane protein